ncbi:Prostaglandin F2 Receptor Negative Regulator [Manis pentadactyla]|nr:Prostaglandin F2 Receptor Negative Regulator [Manis pentadactyla]
MEPFPCQSCKSESAIIMLGKQKVDTLHQAPRVRPVGNGKWRRGDPPEMQAHFLSGAQADPPIALLDEAQS